MTDASSSAKKKKGHAIPDYKKYQFSSLEALDLSRVHDADGLLRSMSKTSFGGRSLGTAADVLYEMVTDPDCFTVLTMSGAMTVAKMGLLVCDMIEQGMVQAVISTGALITHGLVENAGMTHLRYDFDVSDEELYLEGYDRVYDTLEIEKNLDDLDEIIHQVFDQLSPDETICSRVLCSKIGRFLHETKQGRGILKSAYLHHVPVYIPAMTDSELGIDFAVYNRQRRLSGKPIVPYNPFLDLDHFSELILRQKTTGIFTIGGGVPRNWAQQVAPLLDLVRLKIIDKNNAKKYFMDDNHSYNKRYKYAVRICPEPVYWGSLSGCTYSEGVSWGKFCDSKKDGRFAEVLSDATLVWPLLLKGVQERLEKNGLEKINKNFSNEETLRILAV